jgi:hypothetical protein
MNVPIRLGQNDELTGRPLQAAAQRKAVTLLRLRDQACRCAPHNLGAAIARIVVDDHNLVNIAAGKEILNRAPDSFFFVVTWRNYADRLTVLHRALPSDEKS